MSMGIKLNFHENFDNSIKYSRIVCPTDEKTFHELRTSFGSLETRNGFHLTGAIDDLIKHCREK